MPRAYVRFTAVEAQRAAELYDESPSIKRYGARNVYAIHMGRTAQVHPVRGIPSPVHGS
jgi:hypothetical protein